MERPIVSGSKPRKLIPKVVLTNPSLMSLSLTSILDPENHSLPRIADALQKREQAVAHRQTMIFNELSPARFAREASLPQRTSASVTQMDSLQLAEHQFRSKKTAPTPSLPPVEGGSSPVTARREPMREFSQISRGSSVPSLLGNYSRTDQIKAKQAKHFNIISNL